MGALFTGLTIKNLAERQMGVIRQSTNTRPTIRLVEDNGVQEIAQDVSVHASYIAALLDDFFCGGGAEPIKNCKGLKEFLFFTVE
jgi:hypothetical protein